jgi:prohibitin 1
VFTVDGGHRAVIFDRFSGVKNQVVGEGTHFFIPWIQRPIIFDIRSRPRNVPVVTGSKGNQIILFWASCFSVSDLMFLSLRFSLT